MKDVALFGAPSLGALSPKGKEDGDRAPQITPAASGAAEGVPLGAVLDCSIRTYRSESGIPPAFIHRPHHPEPPF